MSLNDWIVISTIVITITPLIKMAKEKRFGFYNFSIVFIGAAILVLSICKNRNDDALATRKERDYHISDSTNKSEIKSLKSISTQSQQLLSRIDTSLNSIGLKLDSASGKISVSNQSVLEKYILTTKAKTNVTSINQQGGQTAGEITNHN
jgi:hypothetical protein